MATGQGVGFALLATAIALASGPACAAEQSGGFAVAPGFTEISDDDLYGDDYYNNTLFPSAGESVFMPDSDLVAPVRAMLLMETQEGELPHARYRVTYDLHSEADDPNAMNAEVEITRINLGAAFREQAMEGVPEEHQGPAEAFGIGPHVAWRFEMMPIQGMTSHVVKVSRKELSDAEAGRLDCLGAPCSQLDSADGPEGNWVEHDQPDPSIDYRAVTVDGPDPAYVVDQMLTVMMGEDGPRATGPSEPGRDPRFTFVVSVNAGGQDVMTTGLGRNAVVFDDAIGTVWVRTRQHSDRPGELEELDVPRAR